jgi:hypothetical protein
MITGQVKRIVELTIDATVVRGSLTSGTSTVAVKGEFKDGGLSFWTDGRQEFFLLVFEDGAWRGTYVDSRTGRGDKTGVTLKRPSTN